MQNSSFYLKPKCDQNSRHNSMCNDAHTWLSPDMNSVERQQEDNKKTDKDTDRWKHEDVDK